MEDIITFSEFLDQFTHFWADRAQALFDMLANWPQQYWQTENELYQCVEKVNLYVSI